jgi:hypothetical protein
MLSSNAVKVQGNTRKQANTRKSTNGELKKKKGFKWKGKLLFGRFSVNLMLIFVVARFRVIPLYWLDIIS